MNWIEREYKAAINRAYACGDDGEAYDLSMELKDYRDHYKVTEVE